VDLPHTLQYPADCCGRPTAEPYTYRGDDHRGGVGAPHQQRVCPVHLETLSTVVTATSTTQARVIDWDLPMTGIYP